MLSNIPNRFYRISVKALILDETRSRFLVVQEDNGKWEFPGGGLDWGENYVDGLKRELREEMGLETIWIDVRPSYFITRKGDTGDIWMANVFFEVKTNGLAFTPSEECVALRFVTAEEAKLLEAFPNVYALADIFNLEQHQ